MALITIQDSIIPEYKAEVTASRELRVTGNLTATNPSVSLIGNTAPTYGTLTAAVDPSGNLQPLKVDVLGNLLVSGSGSSSNLSVGPNNSTAPTYSTQVGGVDLSGNLQAVTVSSNGLAGNELLHVQTPDTTTATTTLGSLNASVTMALAGLSSAGFQINAGTLIGTIKAQASIDGGTNWTDVSFYDPANSTVIPSLTFGSANSLRILSILPIGGSSHVRVLVSAYTSGSSTGLLRGSQVTGAAGAVTAAAFSQVVTTYPALVSNTASLILAANPNRKYASISNNSGSTTTLQFGSATGLTGSTGKVIPNQSFYEIKGDNLYTGAIYGFSASNITLSVEEGTP